MKTFAYALLIAVALMPFAAARPNIPEPPVEAGPCVASWGLSWPGETVGARCDVHGTSTGAGHGTCSVGYYLRAHAGTVAVSIPCDGLLLGEILA